MMSAKQLWNNLIVLFSHLVRLQPVHYIPVIQILDKNQNTLSKSKLPYISWHLADAPFLSLLNPLPLSEGDAGSGQPSGSSADPPTWRDPPAEGGAGVRPAQGDAGRCDIRAGGVWGGVWPAVWHPHEGCLRSVHPSKTPGPHQNEHQLKTFLTVLTLLLKISTLQKHLLHLFPTLEMFHWSDKQLPTAWVESENENNSFNVLLGLTCMRKRL